MTARTANGRAMDDLIRWRIQGYQDAQKATPKVTVSPGAIVDSLSVEGLPAAEEPTKVRLWRGLRLFRSLGSAARIKRVRGVLAQMEFAGGGLP